MKMVAAAFVMVLAGFAALADQPALEGTSWRLVQFSGPAGTSVPPRVERYGLAFSAGGQLAMTLDCNRAMARWQFQDGRLTVSPGMMTRAFCGEGALDSRIAADMSKIESVALSGGRLTLTLQGGAGAYVWEAATP